MNHARFDAERWQNREAETANYRRFGVGPDGRACRRVQQFTLVIDYDALGVPDVPELGTLHARGALDARYVVELDGLVQPAG
jgi:hypothetical protein